VSDETFATDRPATFREVFESREFRFVFSSTTLSFVGDHLAKVAVTALVFQTTHSVALSAAAFALSYLPWAAGGPVLATIAERYPFRRVMVTCDVIQMLLIALIAIPGMPVWAMLVLLFAAALANPPFQAARSAMLPQLLEGDRYVVGLSLHQSTRQVAQITGYALGGAIAPFYPRLALLLDAATFAVSALLIRYGVGDRRPIGAPVHHHLGRDTVDGFRVVFGTPVLRAIAVLVFTSMLFAIVPEGLAAAWAADLAETNADRGWMQALIMAAHPIGFVIGGLIVGRLVAPERRRQLIRPFAVLAPLALIPAFLSPPVFGIAVMAAVCGFATAGLIPPTNGLFVQALPASYRARAYGVMQGGVQVMQGIAVLATGLLAERFGIPLVVGLWSTAGVLVVLFAVSRWPSRAAIARAIETAQAVNGTAEHRPAPPQRAGVPGTNEREHVGRHRQREASANTPTNGVASRALARGREIVGMPPNPADPEHSEASL